jgi:hypothetical protein
VTPRFVAQCHLRAARGASVLAIRFVLCFRQLGNATIVVG